MSESEITDRPKSNYFDTFRKGKKVGRMGEF